jgi:DNA invertase Pin-like site-specific DNA recombinase
MVKRYGVKTEENEVQHMKFGYIRVSTRKQARDGNSLEAQREALTAAGAEKIYTDAFTGTRMERPEWDKLRAQLRRGDVLIVTRLDRLARSVSQASGLITDMIDEGVTINVLNLGILSNDSVNTLLRNVLLSFAQFERDMIVQRTQEGKAVARATDPDFREGRPPKFDAEQLDHAMELLENHSYTQVVKLTGISKSTLIRERKRRKNF